LVEDGLLASASEGSAGASAGELRLLRQGTLVATPIRIVFAPNALTP